jgi:hypothetical protein
MGVFGKLFDPSGEAGGGSGEGEQYEPDPGRAEVDLDAGVLILPPTPPVAADPEPPGETPEGPPEGR